MIEHCLICGGKMGKEKGYIVDFPNDLKITKQDLIPRCKNCKAWYPMDYYKERGLI